VVEVVWVLRGEMLGCEEKRERKMGGGADGKLNY